MRRADARGLTTVFTNGCFDLVHAGHVALLERAKACGDLLVVGVNSDRSVRALKGRGRPIVGARDRALVLAALASVDFVTIFDEDRAVKVDETALLSEPALAQDWNRPEEDAVWSYLQPAR